jgi:hypothetical protein
VEKSSRSGCITEIFIRHGTVSRRNVGVKRFNFALTDGVVEFRKRRNDKPRKVLLVKQEQRLDN